MGRPFPPVSNSLAHYLQHLAGDLLNVCLEYNCIANYISQYNRRIKKLSACISKSQRPSPSPRHTKSIPPILRGRLPPRKTNTKINILLRRIGRQRRPSGPPGHIRLNAIRIQILIPHQHQLRVHSIQMLRISPPASDLPRCLRDLPHDGRVFEFVPEREGVVAFEDLEPPCFGLHAGADFFEVRGDGEGVRVADDEEHFDVGT